MSPAEGWNRIIGGIGFLVLGTWALPIIGDTWFLVLGIWQLPEHEGIFPMQTQLFGRSLHFYKLQHLDSQMKF